MPTLVEHSPFAAFKVRAEAVSAEVHRVATRAEALRFIVAFLREAKIADAARSRAVWAGGSLLEGVNCRLLAEEIPGLTFHITQDAAEQSKVGISQLEWAISDTGTLLMDAAPVERRLVSALPEIHIAVVATGAILPDMAAAFERLSPRQSGYLSMITGPSRTADIERVLTIGVHGPSRLIVVFVDELEAQR